ncbi:chorismate mutase [Lentzea sp. DG1S-22]|uniref:chorismate mutase n=1 Tax=Lentzea sp. DG1S-22 TaxID=3108822 RepID=UPI002E783745|nr:chorismate mutase [Lentzea sp. DG1S-22]WVH82088.1 chorismate mutase [Lentzea sp. DG1S-22]
MDSLRPFRSRIEKLDEALAEIVADRLRVCAEVAAVKKAEGIPMMQPQRVAAVCDAYARRGRESGVSESFMRDMAMLIIGEACRLEDEIIEDEPSVDHVTHGSSAVHHVE